MRGKIGSRELKLQPPSPSSRHCRGQFNGHGTTRTLPEPRQARILIQSLSYTTFHVRSEGLVPLKWEERAMFWSGTVHAARRQDGSPQAGASIV